MSKKHSKPAAARPAQKQVRQQPVKKDRATLWLTGILAITFIAFFPSFQNQFVNWDDYAYIVDNPVIKDLSLKNIAHIFNINTYVVGNYHPLTVLSYCLEYNMVKVNPFLYHFDNVLIHLFNIALLFLILRKLTDNLPVVIIASLLFAVHPMRVESVTWAAERKDVLYTLFYLLSTYTYLLYVKADNKKYYIFSILLFLGSILSKGQAVVLPLTLLLIDYYMQRKFDRKAIVEKIPYFALSLVFGIIAVLAQHTSLTAQRLDKHSILERLMFACYGIVQYLYKLILPINLSCFYVYPEKTDGLYPIMIYISPLIVAGLLYLVYRFRTNRFLVFGALYFLFTASIVLQVLPVGDAIIAERYTYIPYIGLFFIAAVFLSRLAQKSNGKIMIAVYFVILAIATYARTKDWKNSEVLWTDVIKKYPQTALAYNDRGVVELDQNRLDEALSDFTNAVKYNSLYFEAYNNRALAFGKKNMHKEEIENFTRAVEIANDYTTAYFNRGLAYVSMGEPEKALADYREVLKREPDNAKCYYSIGIAYKNLGNDSLAVVNYSIAVEKNPYYEDAYNNRGNIYYRNGKYDLAISDYNKAIESNPSSGTAYFNRSAAYFSKKQFAQALDDVMKAQSLGYAADSKYIDLIKYSMQGGK